ncbi:MAG: hypothetical protein QOG13_724 [Sphingomonadales bacterium]|jgi:hypothetical protein|nr:hypothetical protein [Sphingomonadales bacterium]MEA3044388.1 hypothetical protein [Sphingomonadales bacterium]
MTDGPTIPPPPGGSKSLINRVKDILVTPKTEWAVIDAEPATIQGIYTSYVVILAAIGPIAMLIGQQLVGISILGVTYKPSMTYSIGSAVLTYVMSLVIVYVAALIIDALAPTFGGTKDSLKAFKVAAYSATAGWCAAIFNIIPMLGWLGLIGALYGLYLLYLGLPRLMRVADDKAVGYTVVVIVVQIVLYFVVAMIVATLIASFFGLGALAGGGGTVVRY